LTVDMELTTAAAMGEREAVATLAARLAPRVLRLCRLLLPAEDAEDAAQMALMTILRDVGAYRGEASLQRWADRLAGRVAFKVRARTRRHGARWEADLSPDDLAVADAWRPDVPTGLGDLTRPLLDYLDALDEEVRAALILHHGLGHTVPEISSLTGTSPHTIKKRLQRGQAALRRLIRRDRVLPLSGRRELP
jgi:RNA polymerase sigma-70 factor (ECF subfamily)